MSATTLPFLFYIWTWSLSHADGLLPSRRLIASCVLLQVIDGRLEVSRWDGVFTPARLVSESFCLIYILDLYLFAYATCIPQAPSY